MQKKVRYWQLTVIVKDDMAMPDPRLTAEVIEHGIRKNLLPSFLHVHDVEAIEIGDKPRRIKPTPDDLKIY